MVPVAPLVLPEAATIPAGVKVWPIKGKTDKALWCVKPVNMARNYPASQFQWLPVIEKFSRFTELNRRGHRYVITMFPKAVRDNADELNVMTFGFVVDLSRVIPNPAK